MSRTPLRRAAPARLARTPLILAAATALLAGCSSDPGVLARVNGEPITAAQFDDAARGSAGRYAGAPDDARARMLHDLIDRKLLLQAARREGLHEAPEFQAFRRQLERQTLREALFRRLLGGPFAVSEAEVRELYRLRGTSTRARLIFTFDKVRAREALEELSRGTDFAVVADRFNPRGMVPPGGDIGFTEPGAMLPPLDDAVCTGPIGRVLGPLTGGGEGAFIVRVEERRPHPQPPLDQVQTMLSDMLRQRKQRLALVHALDVLRIEHAVTVLPGAPQTMMKRFRLPPDAEPDARVAPPDSNERRQALAQYREGVYTLGDAYDDLLTRAGKSLDLSLQPTVQQWLEAQTLERAVIAEASIRHLQDEPEVRRSIRDRLDGYLLRDYYQRHVAERVRVGPEDLRAAYQRLQSSFVRLRTARVITVTMRDSNEAATLAVQASHALNLRDAAVTAGSGGRVGGERLAFPASSPLWTRFEGRLASMAQGEIAGPYAVTGGWLLFQLVEKQQEAMPFGSLSPESRGQLMGAASEMRRQALLTALTDSLRTVFQPIELHADRLRSRPWPSAPAGVAGS